MDEKAATREDVLALSGGAMHAAQELEEAMVGLLGVRSELADIAQARPTAEAVQQLPQPERDPARSRARTSVRRQQRTR